MTPQRAPNIFDFATSELSQDATLCYFLAYADPIYANSPYTLEHFFALNLVGKMFELFEMTPPKNFKKFGIKKQFRSNGKILDILVEIDDTYIAIEDKRQARDHAEQLLNYSKIHETLKVSCEKVLLIYVQTGNQASSTNIKNNNFKLINRTILLELFETEAGIGLINKNVIYGDFYSHILSLENQYKNFTTTPVLDWKTPAQIGFIEALIEKNGGKWITKGGGGGGFRAYQGKSVIVDDISAYLQVEVSNNKQPEIHLCFRVDVPYAQGVTFDADLWNRRREWITKELGNTTAISTVVRRRRFRPPSNLQNSKAEPFSLLLLKINDGQNWKSSRSFPKIDDNALVDVAATVKILKLCQNFLDGMLSVN